METHTVLLIFRLSDEGVMLDVQSQLQELIKTVHQINFFLVGLDFDDHVQKFVVQLVVVGLDPFLEDLEGVLELGQDLLVALPLYIS